MKNILILLLVVAPLLGTSQKWEVGLFGGGSNYIGDVSDGLETGDTYPAVGGLLRYYVTPYFNMRFGITYGVIGGHDGNSYNPDKFERNLSFKSNIYEIALIPEFNVLGFRDGTGNFSPYLFAGVAAFNHNPQALYQGEWIDLQPLGTEGQGTTAFPDREPYSLWGVAIPFGMGFKIGFGDGLNAGIEFGARKTFTDYLDDVSTTYVDRDILLIENGQLAADLSNRSGELGTYIDFDSRDPRGNPTNQDWYMFGGITITYTLDDYRVKNACPTF